MRWLQLAVLALLGTPGSAHAVDIEGRWLTNRRDAVIAFEDCGNATPCGRIVWVAPAKADRPRDIRNPDPALRRRSIQGLTVAWGFARHGAEWRSGRLYNPETGQTFSSAMSREDDGRLRVTGCIGVLCLTDYWTRSGDRDPRAAAPR